MARHVGRATALILASAACAVAPTASAQWVTVARKALGRVEQMTQSQGADGPGYDVAAVMLEAPIGGVWEGVLRALKAKSPGLTRILTSTSSSLRTDARSPASSSASLAST